VPLRRPQGPFRRPQRTVKAATGAAVGAASIPRHSIKSDDSDCEDDVDNEHDIHVDCNDS
jgi:hypothetical protein